ncbi:MAG: peptide ABC transporter permease, partial [Geminicoccaceae bacterium]
MIRFVLTRLGVLIPTFIGVTIVAFALIRLVPGDPIELLVGERGISEERHAELRARFGFDKPLPVQYLTFLGNLVQG